MSRVKKPEPWLTIPGQMVGRILGYLIIVLVPILLGAGVMSVVNWNIDPSDWSEQERTIALGIAFALYVFRSIKIDLGATRGEE